MVPVARQDNLLVQEIGNEVVVYDQERDQAHTLNRTAAFVWRNCDGETTVPQLAALVAVELGVAADEDVVWMALDRLSRANLLEGKVERPGKAVSRRELLRRMSVAGAAAVMLPMVTSLVAPTAAMAASPAGGCGLGTPGSVDEPCDPANSNCCAGLQCVETAPGFFTCQLEF